MVTLLLEAVVIRSNELVSFNIIKEKGVESKATIQPFAIVETWLMTATKMRPEVNKPGNQG